MWFAEKQARVYPYLNIKLRALFQLSWGFIATDCDLSEYNVQIFLLNKTDLDKCRNLSVGIERVRLNDVLFKAII